MDIRKPVIFLTGAATLALELVASRVMTPYFGVSLFIWTGILATTLVCLALGYWLGGRVGRAAAETLFVAAPGAAGIALALAAAVYPNLFPQLARMNLALGSILACAVLIGPTLVFLSAMNPLLVAVLRPVEEGRGDAGAGSVFAWSTFGSVAGVGIAAFALIPTLSNFHGVIAVAAALGGLSILAAAAGLGGGRPFRRRAAGLGAVAILLAGAVLALSVAERRALAAGAGRVGYRVVEVQPTPFGTLKAVDIGRDLDGPPEEVERYLFADGMNMGAETLSGRPTVAFAYALEAFALSHPAPETALMLGLGIGSVPELLAARGVAVDAVEINPDVIDLAARRFGFDPSAFDIHRQDARIFARECPHRYDAILVDLFSGDGIPEHLVTAEFFTDLKRNCLTEDGVVGFNTLSGSEAPAASALVATIVRIFGPVSVMQDPSRSSRTGNAYVVAPPMPGGSADFSATPAQVRHRLERAFAQPVVVTPGDVAGVPPLTDDFNTYAYRGMADQIDYRRSVVRALPPALLVN
ncbi:MAG TPA: fused MFS/spermidine synthase [Alphaproteobacteria bacterium]|nr:fused MFS/spermidine synthase [Alphaproteobacteria bacterium]